MVTIICVDGLAGHPEYTFSALQSALEANGHIVNTIDTSAVASHADRVKLALCAYDTAMKPVVFVGQSAGGSAVRIAAERLEKEGKPLAGVVLLSPAMPRGILFMTRALWSVMKGRVREVFLGKPIRPTEKEYTTLIEPLPFIEGFAAIRSRQVVSGIECRDLLFPPKFVGYSYPTLHIWGVEDRWIAPSAQRKLNTMLKKSSEVTTHELPHMGHLTLASHRREE
ncbi:MAG: alpha/beta hydrolase family protein, partial [Candidatus Paceibacterota bacterium]